MIAAFRPVSAIRVLEYHLMVYRRAMADFSAGSASTGPARPPGDQDA